MLLVGIDVGGTHVKVGLIEDGQMVRQMTFATNAFDIIKQICNSVREIVQVHGCEMGELGGVAVGFPGMIIDNIVKDSPNIGLQECDIKDVIEKDLNVPVVVRNDANMATLAEQKLGAGNNCKNMLYLSFGTGIGGGIIINGDLYEGNGGAGEVGHIILEQGGKPCSCGRCGCAEQYVSLKALSEFAKECKVGYPDSCINENIDGSIYASELVRAYKRNDSCAKFVVDKYVDMVSQYLLNLCNLFRPEKIIIGGGLSHAPEIIEMISKECYKQSFGYKNSPKVDIVPAKLGNDAGIWGAVVFFDGNTTNLISENDENTADDLSLVEQFVEETKEIERKSGDTYERISGEGVVDGLTNNGIENKDVVDNSQEDSVVYDEELLKRVNERLKLKD